MIQITYVKMLPKVLMWSMELNTKQVTSLVVY